MSTPSMNGPSMSGPAQTAQAQAQAQDAVPGGGAGAGYGPVNQNPGFSGHYGAPAGPDAATVLGAPAVTGQPGFAPGPYSGPPPQPAPNQPFAAGPAKATFGSALHSEWTKIRTVRSTFWTLLVTMVITIGLGSLIAWGSSQHPNPDGNDDWTAVSMSGLFLGQLVIVVFGAMAITAEYSTGMIRTSLTSQPRRATLFWAKTTVVAAVSLAVGLVCSFTSFFIASGIYSGRNIHVALSDGGTLRAVFGGGLYLAVSALLAFGLGALLRHTAGAITASVGVLFVAFILVLFLPGNWKNDVGKWIPFNAGTQIISTQPQSDMLSPWGGFAVFVLYAAVAVIGGAVVISNKDA